MSLFAKEKTYEKWFKQGHFIRRHFDYVYKNPLWDKRVPVNFSLCPYFWMSILVGLIGLKMTLVPVVRLSKVLASGSLGVVDRCLHMLWKSSFAKKDFDWEYEVGRGIAPTFVSSILLLLIFSLGMSIGEGISSIWYNFYITGKWGGYGLMLLAPLSISCVAYIGTNQYKDNAVV